jgi:hypothetical protein
VIGYNATGLAATAVVVHVIVPVTFPASPAGEYEISGLFAGSEMLGVVP